MGRRPDYGATFPGGEPNLRPPRPIEWPSSELPASEFGSSPLRLAPCENQSLLLDGVHLRRLFLFYLSGFISKLATFPGLIGSGTYLTCPHFLNVLPLC